MILRAGILLYFIGGNYMNLERFEEIRKKYKTEKQDGAPMGNQNAAGPQEKEKLSKK